MKKLLILFGIILSIALNAQIPGNPDANGVITPGPPDWVTGVPQGDGELKLQLGYLNSRSDSLKDGSGQLYLDSLATGAIIYTDTYWDDLRVPLTNTRISPVNTEPDFEDRGDGLFAWGFDSDSDSAYVLNFTAQGSHARKDSTNEDGHFHWQPDGTNTGNVLWRLIYSIANIGSDFTTPDTLWALDAADGVALKHQIIDFGTLLGSDTMRISHAIVGSVSRVGEDARDTYTGTAFGIELDFHYEIDRPGSEEEFIKY